MTGHAEVTIPRGTFKLFFGFRALAEIQGKHGKGWLTALAEAEKSGNLEDLDFGLLTDIVAAALQRHHADELSEDPFLTDDILLGSADALPSLLATIADDEAQPGNRPAATPRKPRKKASTSPRG